MDIDGQPPPPPDFTPFEGWGPFASGIHSGDAQFDMEVLQAPNPEFWIRNREILVTPAPSAWEMQVTYPAERMGIFEVRPLSGASGGGLVMWSATPSPYGCGSPVTGTLTIQVVDPEPDQFARTEGVGVVFTLTNQDGTNGNPSVPNPCQQRVTPGEVAIVPGSYRGYDIDGNLLADTNQFELLERDLY